MKLTPEERDKYYPTKAISDITGKECSCEELGDYGVPICCVPYFDDMGSSDFDWEHTDSDGETRTHFYDGGMRIECPECNKWYYVIAKGYSGPPLGEADIEFDEWEIEDEGWVTEPPKPPRVPEYSKEFKLHSPNVRGKAKPERRTCNGDGKDSNIIKLYAGWPPGKLTKKDLQNIELDLSNIWERHTGVYYVNGGYRNQPFQLIQKNSGYTHRFRIKNL